MQNRDNIDDGYIGVRACARHWAVSHRKVYDMLEEGLWRAEIFGTWQIA